MSNTLLPTVLIDPNVEVNIILRRLYYRPEGYYQNAEQLLEAATKAGHKFSIDDVKRFLHKQILWQKYSPKPKYIPCASYNRITIPNFAHQADLLYLYHDTEGRYIYKYCLYICDIALYDRSSESVAKAFKEIYKNDTYLIWPKELHVDKGTEFKGEVIELMERKNVRIRV